ncbi:MAG: hypothetical protein ACT4PP_05565 [Sporichthyaceae bacterium]
MSPGSAAGHSTARCRVLGGEPPLLILRQYRVAIRAAVVRVVGDLDQRRLAISDYLRQHGRVLDARSLGEQLDDLDHAGRHA